MTRELATHYGLIFHVAAGMIGFFIAPAAMLTAGGSDCVGEQFFCHPERRA